MKRLLFLCCCILVLSCKEEKIVVINFDLEDFPETVYCKADSIEIESPTSIYFNLIRDSLVVVTCNGKAGHFIEIQNLNNKNDIIKCFSEGLGEGCFISARAVFDDMINPSSFRIVDMMDNCFAEIDIDTLLKCREKFRVKKIFLPGVADVFNICIYDKENFVGQNIYYSHNKEYDNKEDRFLLIKRDEYDIRKDTYNYSSRYKYWVTNTNLVVMFGNEFYNRLWCVSTYMDQFDIYSKDDLQLLYSFRGPRHYDVEYVCNDVGQDLPVVGIYGYHSAYESVVTTDSCVYLLFGNRTYQGGELVPDTIPEKSEVYKFDWNGKPLKRYILDRYAYKMTMDSKGEYFYCSAKKIRSGQSKLIRYKL